MINDLINVFNLLFKLNSSLRIVKVFLESNFVRIFYNNFTVNSFFNQLRSDASIDISGGKGNFGPNVNIE